MQVLYGNSFVRSALEKMVHGSRTAQSVLFYGDKGTGRKTFAKWFAQMLLCENENAPCGRCKNCRTIEKNVHPDVVWVPHSGKLGGFSAETVRNICADAVVAPNSGERKVYIFDDCDRMEVRSQNILLKIIEEPPEYAYFIFTAASRQALLPTVLSRLVPFGISQCSRDETLEALSVLGISADDAQEAYSCFHGNIGMCLEYVNNEKLRSLVSLTKASVRCIIEKREYELLKNFYSAGSERQQALSFLGMLEKVLRDAAVLRVGKDLPCIGCDEKGAAELAGKISASRGQYFYKCILNAYNAINSNVNLQLTLSALCAELMSGRR